MSSTQDTAIQEFFTHDEVALMRFMEMCQEACSPPQYKKFLELSEYLIQIRTGLRDGCFERIASYIGGDRHEVGSPAS
jgi:hypothetical protein